MSKIIETGDVVTIECVGRLANGMVFTDSSEDGPIKFTVGDYVVIQGLNTAVIGMSKGEEKSVTISPDKAFGEYDEEQLVKIPLDQLPPDVEEGIQLASDTEEGEEMIWTVRELVKEEGVAILDGNHVLAGQELMFEIKVTEVEEAPPKA
jgi:peptidylprolyl isomerase